MFSQYIYAFTKKNYIILYGLMEWERRNNGYGKVYTVYTYIYNSYPFHIDNRVMSENEDDFFFFKNSRKVTMLLHRYVYMQICIINATLYKL